MKRWVVAESDALSEGKSLGFRLGDGDWPVQGFLVRVGGKCHAWVNSCPHAGHALNLDPDKFMAPEGRHVRCMSHGARFEPDTGECVSGPCMGQALQPLECFEEQAQVVVMAPASARDL